MRNSLDIVMKIIFGVVLMFYNRNRGKDTQLRNYHLKKMSKLFTYDTLAMGTLRNVPVIKK
jgi:hypothetical protein